MTIWIRWKVLKLSQTRTKSFVEVGNAEYLLFFHYAELGAVPSYLLNTQCSSGTITIDISIMLI